MLMINGLACLLIITSLCVIMVRTAKKAALFYSLQSLVLVLLFVYLANEMQAHELYMWSISAFITKVLLVPAILIYAMKKVDESQTPAGINVAWLIPITAVIVTLCYFVVVPIDLPLVTHLQPCFREKLILLGSRIIELCDRNPFNAIVTRYYAYNASGWCRIWCSRVSYCWGAAV